LGPKIFWCAQAPFGVVVVPMAIVIALMVFAIVPMLLLSSFGSGKCYSYFMLLTLF
jgi:hypothetical protein